MEASQAITSDVNDSEEAMASDIRETRRDDDDEDPEDEDDELDEDEVDEDDLEQSEIEVDKPDSSAIRSPIGVMDLPEGAVVAATNDVTPGATSDAISGLSPMKRRISDSAMKPSSTTTITMEESRGKRQKTERRTSSSTDESTWPEFQGEGKCLSQFYRVSCF